MLRVLFLFDDDIEFGPFRFNMFSLTDRGGKNVTQADIQGSATDLSHLL